MEYLQLKDIEELNTRDVEIFGKKIKVRNLTVKESFEHQKNNANFIENGKLKPEYAEKFLYAQVDIIEKALIQPKLKKEDIETLGIENIGKIYTAIMGGKLN